MTQPNLSVEQAQEVVASKIAPRVTKESIEAKIKSVKYITHEHLTICILTMNSGFFQVGKAAPASPENYDAEVGKRFAYEDAFRGLWQLEGYLLSAVIEEQRVQDQFLRHARTF